MKPRFCRYCRRGPLFPPGKHPKLAITRDHVKARSRGGWKTVQCCHQCNNLKGDIIVEEWFWFIDRHPKYWKTFRTEHEIKAILVAERTRRAFAGEPPIVSKLMGSEYHKGPMHLDKYHIHVGKIERQNNG